MGKEFKSFESLFRGTGLGESIQGEVLGRGTSAQIAGATPLAAPPTQDELDANAVAEARAKAKEALKGRKGRASTVGRGGGAGLLGGETTGSLLGE